MTRQYSVKQLSKLAGVSVRTLHLYDEIGLLKPSLRTEAGYRLYEELYKGLPKEQAAGWPKEAIEKWGTDAIERSEIRMHAFP